MTVKDQNNPGRLVVDSKGKYHQIGSPEGQKLLQNFQRAYNKTKNK